MIIILTCILFYPAIVLLVAITGPHHPAEQEEYRRFKAARRLDASTHKDMLK